MTHRQSPQRSCFYTLDFAIEVVRDIRPVVRRIGKHDGELHSQLKRAMTRCVLALGEGQRREGGNKRLAFRRACGEASEALTKAWIDSEPQTIGGQLWANGFRTFHLVTHNPGPEAADHAAKVARIAADTGSVSANAIAAWALGQVETFVDVEKGVRTWVQGREWSRSLPDHLVDDLLVGLILHVTARRGELVHTLNGCRDALSRALDRHYYAGTSHLFGVTAIALCRADDPETGARLVGSMMANGHLPRRNARRQLESALGDRLDDLLATGGGLTVTQAGRLGIEALDRAIVNASARASTVDGSTVDVRARSICIHGDTPGAVEMARAVRAGLESASVGVYAFVV